MPDTPQGYRDVPEEDRKKAKTFFDRGSTVAGTGQYDYAIEMFIQGLSIDPDAVEAHQTLRDISLRRKASGGKAMGMTERWKLKGGDDKQNMLNSEKLLAFDPGNTDHMLALMQNAYKAGFFDTVLWMGPILFRANTDGGKPNFKIFVALKDTYKALNRFDLAIDAAQAAVSLKPNDPDLPGELKNLSAQLTMTRGNYEGGGSFRTSVKNMDSQRQLMENDMTTRDDDVMSRAIAEAEAQWKAQPDEPGKITKLAEALARTENAAHENRAIEILLGAFERSKQFRFRQQAGKIKIAQLIRAERALREKLNKNPNDQAVKDEYRQFIRDKAEEELKEITLWSDAYPTDLGLKFEMAKRMLILERHGEAIPLLQTSRQDPKVKIDASTLLGKAFLDAEFVDEAVDTFRTLIDEYQVKGDAKSKEMYYWFARSLEAQKEIPQAIRGYSQLAQWDFNYRDVQKRIKALRSGGGASAPPAQT